METSKFDHDLHRNKDTFTLTNPLFVEKYSICFFLVIDFSREFCHFLNSKITFFYSYILNLVKRKTNYYNREIKCNDTLCVLLI